MISLYRIFKHPKNFPTKFLKKPTIKNPSKKRIVFIGDSITHGSVGDNYVKKLMKKLEAGKYEFMLAAPLDKASFKPDLIIVYGNPGQITKLVQAAVFKTGQALTAKEVGSGMCTIHICSYDYR